MNDLQLRLHLREYTIKSSFSGPPSPEEPFLSPHTFQPQPRIFPSAHWYTSPHIVKTGAQGPADAPPAAPPSLTTAVLLALLLAGFTLVALLAYSSPLPSPASLRNDPTPSSGDDPSAPVISKIAFSLDTLHALPPGLHTVHTDPGVLSTHENLSNSTHSGADSKRS